MTETTQIRHDGLLCPACRIDLVMSDRQGIEIDYCPKCRGVWLDRGELDKIIERSAREEGPVRAAGTNAPGFIPQPDSPGPWGAAPLPVQAPAGYPSYQGSPPQGGHGGYDANRGGHGSRGSHGGGSHGGSRGFLGRIFD